MQPHNFYNYRLMLRTALAGSLQDLLTEAAGADQLDNSALLADGSIEGLDELVGMHKVGSYAEFNLDDLEGSFLGDAELGE